MPAAAVAEPAPGRYCYPFTGESDLDRTGSTSRTQQRGFTR